MKEKIKSIILNDTLSSIDKVILIHKEVDKTEEGLIELSNAVGVPLIILRDYTPVGVVQDKKQKKSTGNNIQNFIKEFYERYQEAYKVNYKFPKKEIGQLSGLVKKLSLMYCFEKSENWENPLYALTSIPVLSPSPRWETPILHLP